MSSRRALSAAVATVASLLVACEQSRTVVSPRADAATDASRARTPSADYTPLDLGTLGGPFTSARDINERGQVVGSSSVRVGNTVPSFLVTRPFIWTEAAGMVDLGTIAPNDLGIAVAINNFGVAVGFERDAAGDFHAMVWTAPGEVRELGAPAGFTAEANDINDHGVIVGRVTSKEDPTVRHAVRWLPDGTMEDLRPMGGTNAALSGINRFGDVTLNVDQGQTTHVFVVRRNRPPVDIGNLGGSDGAAASAISNRGHVTGLSATSDGKLHAFLWTEAAGLRDIDPDVPIASSGVGVNSFGVIVGQRTVAEEDGQRAFVWTAQGGMRELPPLAGANAVAWAINELGQIVGMSQTASGEFHAVLWRPALRRPF